MVRAFVRVLAVATVFSATVSQATIELKINNISNAGIQFSGGSSFGFYTSDPNGNQWKITSSKNTTDSSTDGLYGSFSGGTGGMWSYSVYKTITAGGMTVQKATVDTTSGCLLTIHDSQGKLATANVSWMTISTSSYGGTVNTMAAINLSNMKYDPTGTNADLKKWNNGEEGKLVLNWSSTYPIRLDTLNTKFSFDGGISYTAPVPEATTMLAGAGALALLLLGAGAQTKRSGVIRIGK